jgi:type VI secretion system protein ImpC
MGNKAMQSIQNFIARTIGLTPLVHRKSSGVAALIDAQSMAKPDEYDDPAATTYSNLSARPS